MPRALLPIGFLKQSHETRLCKTGAQGYKRKAKPSRQQQALGSKLPLRTLCSWDSRCSPGIPETCTSQGTDPTSQGPPSLQNRSGSPGAGQGVPVHTQNLVSQPGVLSPGSAFFAVLCGRRAPPRASMLPSTSLHRAKLAVWDFSHKQGRICGHEMRKHRTTVLSYHLTLTPALHPGPKREEQRPWSWGHSSAHSHHRRWQRSTSPGSSSVLPYSSCLLLSPLDSMRRSEPQGTGHPSLVHPRNGRGEFQLPSSLSVGHRAPPSPQQAGCDLSTGNS